MMAMKTLQDSAESTGLATRATRQGTFYSSIKRGTSDA